MAKNEQSATKKPTASDELTTKGGQVIDRTPVKLEEFALPAGFTQVNLDIVGFWNEDCMITCVPLNVKLFDNKVENVKSSALITVKLLEPIEVRTSEGEVVPAEPGSLVGIWGRPGLRELKVLGNCRVAIVPDGEIPVKDKPNPMRAFKIFSHQEDTPTALKVALDKREKSRGTENLWVSSAEGELTVAAAANTPAQPAYAGPRR